MIKFLIFMHGMLVGIVVGGLSMNYDMKNLALKADVAYYDSHLIDEYNVDLTNDYNNRNDFAKSYNFDFSPVYSANSSKFLASSMAPNLVIS